MGLLLADIGYYFCRPPYRPSRRLWLFINSSTTLYCGACSDVGGHGGYSTNALPRAQAWSWHAEAMALQRAIQQKKETPANPVDARRTVDGEKYEWDVGLLQVSRVRMNADIQQHFLHCIERADVLNKHATKRTTVPEARPCLGVSLIGIRKKVK